MKKSYIVTLFAAAALLASCSKENPFEGGNSGTGQFLKSALSVDVDADGLDVRVTRAAEANIDDFNIIFTADGQSQPVATYVYGEMPEIVTLPAGEYTVTATYGENRDADWENPHFLGTSQKFAVNPFEITSYVDPIVCRLENIKVTIDFDDALRAHMTPESYVEVKVGDSSSLKYGVAEAQAEKAGYFRHTEEITLVAVFRGNVDGAEVVETKSLKNVSKGNHYKITFRLHQSADSEFNGSLNADLRVDASVDVTDLNYDVPLVEDQPLDDSERPVEGEKPGVTDPDPEHPGQPEDPADLNPVIYGEAPVDIDAVNNGADLSACVLHIKSVAEEGITELTCRIVSDPLEEVLEPSGMVYLNLAETPEDYRATLEGWGFPTNVKGAKEVKFEISGDFLNMMGELGSYEHHFVITVKDANGSCTKTLKLKY